MTEFKGEGYDREPLSEAELRAIRQLLEWCSRHKQTVEALTTLGRGTKILSGWVTVGGTVGGVAYAIVKLLQL